MKTLFMIKPFSNFTRRSFTQSHISFAQVSDPSSSDNFVPYETVSVDFTNTEICNREHFITTIGESPLKPLISYDTSLFAINYKGDHVLWSILDYDFSYTSLDSPSFAALHNAVLDTAMNFSDNDDMLISDVKYYTVAFSRNPSFLSPYLEGAGAGAGAGDAPDIDN